MSECSCWDNIQKIRYEAWLEFEQAGGGEDLYDRWITKMFHNSNERRAFLAGRFAGVVESLGGTPGAEVRNEFGVAPDGRITEWFVTGEIGRSSKALALVGLGTDPEKFPGSWPLDPSDLRRCLLLFGQVPELRWGALLVLAAVYPEWAALEGIWDTLSETLRREIGEGLSKHAQAPKTYELMHEAIKEAAK